MAWEMLNNYMAHGYHIQLRKWKTIYTSYMYMSIKFAQHSKLYLVHVTYWYTVQSNTNGIYNIGEFVR